MKTIIYRYGQWFTLAIGMITTMALFALLISGCRSVKISRENHSSTRDSSSIKNSDSSGSKNEHGVKVSEKDQDTKRTLVIEFVDTGTSEDPQDDSGRSTADDYAPVTIDSTGNITIRARPKSMTMKERTKTKTRDSIDITTKDTASHKVNINTHVNETEQHTTVNKNKKPGLTNLLLSLAGLGVVILLIWFFIIRKKKNNS